MNSERSRATTRRTSASGTASSLGQRLEALRNRPGQLNVERLREIGLQIELSLRDRIGSPHAGLDAAALFTATCSTRPATDQETLLGVQDKVLARLRAFLSSALPQDLYRPVQAALLPYLTQPAFVKKRRGYRDHLVQALVDAASGPVPPSTLLPIVRARETGPAAADLVLEVLERITGETDTGGGHGGGDGVKQAVIELLHHVVAEVVSSGATRRGRRGVKGPPAHLISFLGQACSKLPDYVLVFAKDLLVLMECRSSSARKLSLAVLAAVLEYGRTEEGGGQRPALATVLRLARSDGDATVRCSAFDTVAGYLGGKETVYFSRRADDPPSSLDNNGPHDFEARRRSRDPRKDAGDTGRSSGRSSYGDGSDDGTADHALDCARDGSSSPVPCVSPPRAPSKTCATSTQDCNANTTAGGALRRKREGKKGRAGEAPAVTSAQEGARKAAGTSPVRGERCEEDRMTVEHDAAESRGRKGGGRGSGPWAVGGALFLSLSASADALLVDGSKAVRAKALACSLRILEVHGRATRSCDDDGLVGSSGDRQVASDGLEKALSAVAKGAWAALGALATDNGGSITLASHSSVGIGGGRHRKTADTARDLLTLPCIEALPVDLCLCYEGCRAAFGADEGGATGAAEAKRALRDVAKASFCGDIGKLLRAVSDVMCADERGEGGKEYGGDEVKKSFSEVSSEFSRCSCSEVLVEVLAGIDPEVIASLLHETLEAYAVGDDVNLEQGNSATVSAPALLRTLGILAEANGNADNDRGDGGENGTGAKKHSRSSSQARLNATGDSGNGNDGGQVLVRVLAGRQRLFWRRLEQRMKEIEHYDQEGKQEEPGGLGVGEQDELHRRSAWSAVGTPAGDGAGDLRGMDVDDESAVDVPVGDGTGGGGRNIGDTIDNPATAASEVVSELSELLRIFRLLAARSLITSENSAALEALVFPVALSRRRLIRPAVSLALALEEPHRVLLSSLAILQDAAFSRSSTDVGRACDYVRLIGVLARENASFIVTHVRELYGVGSKDRTDESPARGREERTAENGKDDYMAEVSNRAAMVGKEGDTEPSELINNEECDIRRLREASVTSDGMLSCYTPFLLAIVRRRVADATSAREEGPPQPSPPVKNGLLGNVLLSGDGGPGGAVCAAADENFSGHGVDGSDIRHGCESRSGSDVRGRGTRKTAADSVGGRGEKGGTNAASKMGGKGGGATSASTSASGASVVDLSCPRALCVEALWALSEYAVLSPELAAAEVLPLAERLATDTLEHSQIRKAAVGVLTRRELATDESAARVCSLLKDGDPRLRQEVLGRLDLLMKESRIKTAHLSSFALLLVDVAEDVRRTAQAVFFDHLQPRPDTVCRCLFETFFTLDAEQAVRRRVLQCLVAVARRAVPGQGLEPLTGALVRKAAETGDSDAAFFLSLVPPTVHSLEAAEVALRRGQLAQAPRDAISFVADHFSNCGARRGGGSSASASVSAGTSATTPGGRATTNRGEGNSLPPKVQVLEIAARIRALVERGRTGRPRSRSARGPEGKGGVMTTGSARPLCGQSFRQVATAVVPAVPANQGADGIDGGDGGDKGGEGSHQDARRTSGVDKIRSLKKRGRPREKSRGRGDAGGDVGGTGGGVGGAGDGCVGDGGSGSVRLAGKTKGNNNKGKGKGVEKDKNKGKGKGKGKGKSKSKKARENDAEMFVESEEEEEWEG